MYASRTASTSRIASAVTVAVAAALTVAVSSWSAVAHAQSDTDFDIATFRPAPGAEAGMLAVEDAELGEPGALSLGVWVSQTRNPFNLEFGPGVSIAPVSQRTTFELGVAYALGGRYEIGLLVPLMQQAGEDGGDFVIAGADPGVMGTATFTKAEGFSLGDIGLHGKMRLASLGPLGLAASALVTVPSGTGDYAGVAGPTLHARAIAGGELVRNVSLALNAGFRARTGGGELGDIEQGNEFTYGIAGAYRVASQVWLISEIFGASGLTGGDTTGTSPLEVNAGVRIRITRSASLAGGVGRGLMPGIGAPDFRGFAMLSVSPKASEIPEFGPPPKPIDRDDDDGDGIINENDKCPGEPEDRDLFEDDDGCPDTDNDGDGFLDADDRCPDKPEDRDEFQDDDGCPEDDNDNDGIPDERDECPNEPEDLDGFRDIDGCPEPDNDNDGVPDQLDQCVMEPEKINGNDDDDGCPDEGESLVIVSADRLEVFAPIQFRGNSAVLQRASEGVLAQVGATLRANRGILKLRIAVHVHPRGRNDERLSEQRADAVSKWLTKWGVEPERLEVRGYGSSQPLVSRRTRGAAAINDRVEFVIIEKAVRRPQ